MDLVNFIKDKAYSQFIESNRYYLLPPLMELYFHALPWLMVTVLAFSIILIPWL